MNHSQIIKQAKHFFGKDRSFVKELILSMNFKEKHPRKWQKDLVKTLSKPNRAGYNLFDRIPVWIKDNQIEEVDWNWIGELSWDIDILLNPNINKGYDWGSKLASKCKNGTIKILTLYISDVLPCYTYYCHYETHNKKNNLYESGPLHTLTSKEKKIIKKLNAYFKEKNFQLLEKEFYSKKHKALYSDTNKGNASLFDVLFWPQYLCINDVRRSSYKDIIEKNGTKMNWLEIYDTNGVLQERSESRRTIGGDLFKITLDAQHHIKEFSVSREIEGKKYQQFNLDILKTFKKRQLAQSKKKRR